MPEPATAGTPMPGQHESPQQSSPSTWLGLGRERGQLRAGGRVRAKGCVLGGVHLRLGAGEGGVCSRELRAVGAPVAAQEALVGEGRADELDLDPISHVGDEALDGGVERRGALRLERVIGGRATRHALPHLVRLCGGQVGVDDVATLRREGGVHERGHGDESGRLRLGELLPLRDDDVVDGRERLRAP
eukprot:scaffold35363_cov56-Phaeocystis_antarctica.AAC.2